MTLPTGFRLGPYEILAPIGAGGMGEVYRARDERLKREVAIKVLPASLSENPDRLRRFEQEAQAAGALNHPNITAVYDIGEHDGAPYVVQELLEGETLRAELSGGPLSPRQAIEYALQIAQGLAAAHDKGIVHRDLKPENLFVTNDGRVKILDFGLAKLTQSDGATSSATNLPTETRGTEPGVVMGTLGYMSPEQVRGRVVDARSDIFSFGAILYEMFSGNRAFRGDSAADTMSSILKEDPPDLSVTGQNVGPALDRIVRHCLEKTPDRRFQSARDLAFDLEALSGTSAQAPIAAAAVSQISRRRILRAAGIAVTAAAALAVAYLLGRGAAVPRTVKPPVFRRLTFRRGLVLGGRFAPDGKTIVYSAAWDGKPSDTFLARSDGGDSKPLGLPNSRVLSVSREGSLAVRLVSEPNPRWGLRGTIAEVPMLGGAPRAILEEAFDADWSPDGKQLAALRQIEGRFVLEFPIGKKIDEGEFGFGSPRVSPDGRRVAYVRSGREKDSIVVSEPTGEKRVLAQAVGVTALAWHPSGLEIWFDASGDQAGTFVGAVTLDGKRRTLLAGSDYYFLCDVGPDGSALLERRSNRYSLYFRGPNDGEDRDLTWLDSSEPVQISPDGALLLFEESGDAGGTKGVIFLRRTDGSPPVRLGEGKALSLSPDGKWALALLDGKLRLYPTGPGQARDLATKNVQPLWAKFFPDGRRIRLMGSEPGHEQRNWVMDLPSGTPKPITPEGAQGHSVLSPDGALLAVRFEREDAIFIFSVEGGERRKVPGVRPGEAAIQWSDDGAWLYVMRPDEPPPLHVDRVEIATGRREPWRALAPADRAGLFAVRAETITPDGRAYAYTASRAAVSDLYVVEGLK